MSASAAPVIVVFGATGTVGRPLCAALSASAEGFRIRALTRNTNSEAAVELAKLPRVETLPVDHSSDAAVKQALDGVTRLHLCFAVPFDPNNAAIVSRWLRLGGSQLEMVVYLSAGACIGDVIPPYGLVHGQCQQVMWDSGLRCAVLGPNSFMQNFITPATKPMMGVNNSGKIVGMLGDAAFSMADARDIADCAAAILSAPTSQLQQYAGQRYLITGGPPLRTMAELAALLSAHFSRSIEYEDLQPEQYRDWLMTQLHFPAAIADMFVDGMSWVRQGNCSTVGSGVETILGRQPRTWDDFLRDYSDSFEWDDTQTGLATTKYGKAS